MNKPIQSILIVGGGTAGWMTASYLTKAFQESVKITLIESETIKKLGVGEATLPSLQKMFFDFLEIPEDNWMKYVNGSFKVGIKYINWHTTPEIGKKDDYFYHIFGGVPTCDGIPLQQYWLHKYLNGKTTESMHYACYPEANLIDKNLSPRFKDGNQSMFYAWHFDAHLVVDYLKDWSCSRGVTQIIDDVIGVSVDADGNIQSIETKKGQRLSADLYIDCSGFRSLLLKQALNESFIDMSDQLLCDSAVAATIPHDDKKFGVEPFTSSIAMKNGWTWKIPMRGRFGSGYVFSSKFCSRDEATRDFQQLWKLDENHQLNQIKFDVGRTCRFWVKNCVGIGTSSCFLEPLESTGIYFIYAAIYQLVKHFPSKEFEPQLRDQFNAKIASMYDECRDFVQMHYFTTSREDTKFWKANRYELRIEDSIKDKIELYKAGLPVGSIVSNSAEYYNLFDFELDNFWANANYYCVLTGMGIYPNQVPHLLSVQSESINKAEVIFEEIKLKVSLLSQQLPSTYQTLNILHGLTCN